MLTFNELAYVFITNVIVIGLSFIIGRGVNKMVPAFTAFQGLFIQLFLGFVILTALFALTMTVGKSFAWGLVFTTVFAIWASGYKYREKYPNPKNLYPNVKQLAWIFLPVVLIFVVLALKNNFSNGTIFSVNEDPAYYAQLVRVFNTVGAENRNVHENLILPEAQGFSLYHYFDIWISALFAKFFGINPYFSYTLNYSFMINVLTFLGFLSIYNIYTKNIFKLIIFSFLSIFSTTILLNQTGIGWLDNSAGWGLVSPIMSSLNYPKTTAITCFLLVALLFYLHKAYEMAFIWFVAIGVVNHAMLPIVCSVGVLVLIFNRYTQFFDRLQILQLSLFTLLIIASILVPILIASPKISLAIAAVNPQILSFSVTDLKTMVNIVVKSMLQITLLFLPIFLYFLYLFIKNKSPLTLIGLATLIVSLSGWAFLHKMIDSIQFYQNIGVPVLVLASGLCLVQFNQTITKRFIKIGLTVWFIAVALSGVVNYFERVMSIQSYTIPTKSFLNHVRDAVAPESVNAFGYMQAASTIGQEIGIGMASPKCYFMYNLFGGSSGYNLSIQHFEALANKLKEIDLLNANKLLDSQVFSSPFWQFCEQLKSKGQFNNYEEAGLQFLNSRNIKYLVLEKDTDLPACYLPQVKQRIDDPNTGVAFITLR